MLIFDEDMGTVILDDIQSPILTEYFYVLDLTMNDYTLTSLNALEEVYCPTLTLDILGFKFDVPANWYILVYDPETTYLDSVNIGDVAGRDFTGFVFGNTSKTAIPAPIKVIDYDINKKNVSPLMKKTQLLCHPITENMWINITPYDLYNKYLKNMVVGDIIF